MLRAAAGPSLFAAAAEAFFSLVADPTAVRAGERYELTGEAGDLGALLVDWMNDLVWIVEGLGALCSEFTFDEWSETAYRASAFGERIDADRHEFRGVVKAATYHGLEVHSREGGYEARVILDV